MSLGNGFAEIQNLLYPSEVNPGEDFDITYNCVNTGETGELYGKITGIPNSLWKETVPAGSSKPVTVRHNITENFNGELQVGYVSGEPQIPWILLVPIAALLIVGIAVYSKKKK